MSDRKVSNLLALAVLACLAERPMHRYEIASVLKSRGKDRDMSIKWGSLYTVVQNLERHGLLEVVGSERPTARPERVIYRITGDGRVELDSWLKELLSTPSRDSQSFIAGLSIMAMLPPDDVISLLTERLSTLRARIAERRAALQNLPDGLPRIFVVEDEFEIAIQEAEAQWVEEFRDSLASGSFPDLDMWREMQRRLATPDD
ncbi:PadR family transcriptional regulator [Smaragdicoccus niigatensis]|uniref:PadR family transcriptional regulator n=1 Tax=Smaragdicoccus niigatensis TaxID=359359 RepID=UPI000382EB6C|nr:PadR family transcriptional regulator [Smaragdicoccus niigatensis]